MFFGIKIKCIDRSNILNSMALINFDKDMFQVVNTEDQPYVYGSQIATLLEYSRPGNALETHVASYIHVVARNNQRH